MFKRRRKIIDRRFQLRTTFSIICVSLLTFLVIMAVAGINVTRNNREIGAAIGEINLVVEKQGSSKTAESEGIAALRSQAAMLRGFADRNFYLITIILAAVLVQSVILFYYLILVTHRITGPIYVISRHIDEIMEGHHPEFRALRDKDEFREFYEKFILMVEKMEQERKEK